jgi:tetratricopeptide (TPR) repeat protein
MLHEGLREEDSMRSLTVFRYLAIPALALLISEPAWAQVQSRSGPPIGGVITGRVRDARTNSPVVGSVVELQSDAGDTVQQTIVAAGGRFEFRDVQPVRYYLVARASGYRPSNRIQVDLTFMPQQTADISLQSDPSSTGSTTQPTIGLNTLAVPAKAQREFAKAQESMSKEPNPAAAIEHLHQAIHIYPNYVEAYHLLGTLYMDERKWADSENMLRHATELNDHFAPSYFALGALLNQQHKPNEAIKTIEQGLKFEPNSWTGHVELCRSYFALNDVPNAKEHALRAHVLRPDSPVVHISLADVYLAEGDYALARTEYEHFLEKAPQSSLAPKVRDKIKDLDALGHSVNKAPPQ